MASNTVINYIKKYGDIPFEEKPINDVDSVILCQLSYLKFDGMVPLVTENKRSVTLKQLREHKDYEKLYGDERYEKDNRALFEAMLQSERFKGVKLNCYINIIEPEWETQFSAVTCLLEDKTLFIAYRGTDETIVGWKEDFNMAYMSPVPGQAYSVKYLNMVTGKLRSPFYIGGHSKGGNLAVYAAMNCPKTVQNRIVKIYSLDGPGFRPEALEEGHFEMIEDRLVKITPRSSVIGMLFEDNPDCLVVDSTSFGILQHNLFTWKVKEDQLDYVSHIYEGRKFSDDTINSWVRSLDDAKRKVFVDTLYQIAEASQSDNLIDMAADWKKSVSGMVQALSEVDDDTKKMLSQIMKSLLDLGWERILRKRSKKRK